MILETALVASFRISETITESTGTFVNKFNVGILLRRTFGLLVVGS